jgi:hypothetical protein
MEMPGDYAGLKEGEISTGVKTQTQRKILLLLLASCSSLSVKLSLSKPSVVFLLALQQFRTIDSSLRTHC